MAEYKYNEEKSNEEKAEDMFENSDWFKINDGEPLITKETAVKLIQEALRGSYSSHEYEGMQQEQRIIAFDTDKEETIMQLAALRDVIYESCSAVEQVEMMSFPSLVAQLAIREIQQLRAQLGKEKSSI